VNVVFLRHGPAVPSGTAGIPEEDRPLTEEGRQKTKRAARGIARLELGIEEIVTSPLPRAHETALLLSETLRLGRPRVSDRLLPDVPPGRLLEVLDGMKGEVTALVGHEPSLSRAVAFLIGAEGREAVELKKSGLAVVALRSLTPRPEGLLKLLLTPAALRALAR
jgi:phosphohistidine phosphatase